MNENVATKTKAVATDKIAIITMGLDWPEVLHPLGLEACWVKYSPRTRSLPN